MAWSTDWAMARSCPEWAKGPESRAMEEADRGPGGGGFQRVPEVPEVTQMLNTGLQVRKSVGQTSQDTG